MFRKFPTINEVSYRFNIIKKGCWGLTVSCGHQEGEGGGLNQMRTDFMEGKKRKVGERKKEKKG